MNSLNEFDSQQLPDPFVMALPVSAHTCSNLLRLIFRFQGTMPCVQSNPENFHQQYLDRSWQARVSLIILHVLCILSSPLRTVGVFLEMYLNIIRVNGGFLKTIVKLVIRNVAGITVPPKDSRCYLSIVGNSDLRENLIEDVMDPGNRGTEGEETLNTDSKAFVILSTLAAKLAYENEAVIDYIVTRHWNMHFVKFYNCWNDYLCAYTTQAFIFMDKPEEAEFVMVAFRGTELFDANDWSTDFDFSWYSFPSLGRVHIGFLEALGLGNRNQVETFLQLKRNCTLNVHEDERTSGLPSSVIKDPSKTLAFDSICKMIKKLLKRNPNAKLCFTGHSLGGALSALVTTILFYKKDFDILKNLSSIYTFGQPRVGDQTLADFMNRSLEQYKVKYYRFVYSNDLIPRVPADDQILQFKHFGNCLYFNCMYKEKILHSQPNNNYFSVLLFPAIHVTALYELLQSQILWLIYGASFRETPLSTAVRITGLVFPGLAAHSLVNYVTSVLLGDLGIHKKSIKKRLY